ncbi:MAG TPA: YqgE/AlgH family protein [Acidimicrobiia bacterium]|nr:YqgE/AlgH family protein [Acidimicrobiia bacterium]
MPEQPTLRGRLLVAAPPLVDPNFDRTVVLMLEHGGDGGVGVVLNRRSEVTVADVFPEWNELVSPPETVFVGGPVSTDAVIALARRRGPDVEGFVQILDDIGTVDLAGDPLAVGAALASLRVFSGYAGWSPGQLEAEIAQGAWFAVNMERDDPFVADPDRLWRAVLRRQRGRLALFSNYPEDATVN